MATLPETPVIDIVAPLSPAERALLPASAHAVIAKINKVRLARVSKIGEGISITFANPSGGQKTVILGDPANELGSLREAAIAAINSKPPGADKKTNKVTIEPMIFLPFDPQDLEKIKPEYRDKIKAAHLDIVEITEPPRKGLTVTIADKGRKAKASVRLDGRGGEVERVREAIDSVSIKAKTVAKALGEDPVPAALREIASRKSVRIVDRPEKAEGTQYRIVIAGTGPRVVSKPFRYDPHAIDDKTLELFTALAEDIAAASTGASSGMQQKPYKPFRPPAEILDLAGRIGVTLEPQDFTRTPTGQGKVIVREASAIVTVAGSTRMFEGGTSGQAFVFHEDGTDRARFEALAKRVIKSAEDRRKETATLEIKPSFIGLTSFAEPNERNEQLGRRLQEPVEVSFSSMKKRCEPKLDSRAKDILRTYGKAARNIGVRILAGHNQNGDIEFSLQDREIVVTGGHGKERASFKFDGGLITVPFTFDAHRSNEELQRFTEAAHTLVKAATSRRQESANWAIEHKQTLPQARRLAKGYRPRPGSAAAAKPAA